MNSDFESQVALIFLPGNFLFAKHSGVNKHTFPREKKKFATRKKNENKRKCFLIVLEAIL